MASASLGQQQAPAAIATVNFTESSGSGAPGGLAKSEVEMANDDSTTQNYMRLCQQGAFVLETMWNQACSKKFCDAFITVSGQEFTAHRCVLAACSPYFEAMFTSDLKTQNNICDCQTKVTLSCSTPEAIEMILKYMYTGKIDINSENVEDILKGSDHFMMWHLKSRCEKVLGENMDSSNCLGIKQLADLYNFQTLLSRAEELIRLHFMEVIASEEIFKLPASRLSEVLAEDNIRISDESSIYQLVVNWTRHDLEDRRHCFPDLFAHVRLPMINSRFLVEVVEGEPLVQDHQGCKQLLWEAIRHHLAPTPQRSLHNQTHYRPRSGRLREVIVCLTGSHTLGYVIEENRWVELPSASAWWFCEPSSCVVSGQLYATSGLNKRMDRYNPLHNQWLEVPSMLTQRKDHTLAACHGKLYALGGQERNAQGLTVFFRSVECYSPATCTWSYVAPMNEARTNFSVFTRADSHIYVISGYGMNHEKLASFERYDSESNTWSVLQPLPNPNFKNKPVIFDCDQSLHVTDLHGNYQVYDIATNQWYLRIVDSVAEMLYIKEKLSMCVIKDNIYVFGSTGLHLGAYRYNIRQKEWRILAPLPNRVGTLGCCCLLQMPHEFLQQTLRN